MAERHIFDNILVALRWNQINMHRLFHFCMNKHTTINILICLNTLMVTPLLLNNIHLNWLRLNDSTVYAAPLSKPIHKEVGVQPVAPKAHFIALKVISVIFFRSGFKNRISHLMPCRHRNPDLLRAGQGSDEKKVCRSVWRVPQGRENLSFRFEWNVDFAWLQIETLHFLSTA